MALLVQTENDPVGIPGICSTTTRRALHGATWVLLAVRKGGRGGGGLTTPANRLQRVSVSCDAGVATVAMEYRRTPRSAARGGALLSAAVFTNLPGSLDFMDHGRVPSAKANARSPTPNEAVINELSVVGNVQSPRIACYIRRCPAGRGNVHAPMCGRVHVAAMDPAYGSHAAT